MYISHRSIENDYKLSLAFIIAVIVVISAFDQFRINSSNSATISFAYLYLCIYRDTYAHTYRVFSFDNIIHAFVSIVPSDPVTENLRPLPSELSTQKVVGCYV